MHFLRSKRKAEQPAPEYTGPIIFSNKPSGNAEDDLIGVDAHVSAIRNAVANNRIIGVLSDFGAGKSTLIERLRTEYNTGSQKLYKINLWGELMHRSSNTPKVNHSMVSSVDLHKSFLYQFAQQTSSACGAYVNQRLNVGYHLAKLSVKSKRSYWLLAFAAGFFVWSVLFDKELLPFPHILPENVLPLCPMLLSLVAVGIFILFLSKSELLFSTHKNQNSRELHAEDYSELYQHILHTAKCHSTDSILIVFEDIDRTVHLKEVYNFLVELHRYYLVINTEGENTPRVTFLINIKPQELFRQEIKDDSDSTFNEPSLDFIKLFDYTLTLTPLNSADMPALLDELVCQNETFYKRYKVIENTAELTSAKQIPGFSWLAHGRTLDIRRLKHRLNYANQLFYSLSEKFAPKGIPIKIKSCAIAAYLEDEFPKTYYSLKSDTIGEIISEYVRGQDPSLAGWEHAVHSVLNNLNLSTNEPGFRDELAAFLNAEDIDGNYRIYFYNYPKLCNIRAFHEDKVYNALIYNTPLSPDLRADIEAVCSSNTNLIKEAIEYLSNLQRALPDSTFACEALYMLVLQLGHEDKILRYLDDKVSVTTPAETVKLIAHLVGFSRWKSESCRTQHSHLLAILERQLLQADEEIFSRFRASLTTTLNRDTILFSKLYLPPFLPLSHSEAICISSTSDLLVLVDSTTITPDVLAILSNSFTAEEKLLPELQSKLEQIYCDTLHNDEWGFTPDYYTPILCKHMIFSQNWNEEYEEYAFNSVLNEHFPVDDYISFINQMPPDATPSYVLEHIHDMQILSGLSVPICSKLLEAGFGREYFANIHQHYPEKPWSTSEADLFAQAAEDIYDATPKLFRTVRMQLCKQYTAAISRCKSAFSTPLPIITADEIALLPLDSVLTLLPLNNLSASDIPHISSYFCKENRGYALTGKILDYILQLSDSNLRDDLFRHIDFSKLNYTKISATRKAACRSAFEDSYGLNTINGILEYMEHTRYLDKELETSLLKLLLDSDDPNTGFAAYNELLFKPCGWEYTPITLNIVQKDPHYRSRPDDVLHMLYECGNYTNYIASQWRQKGSFVFETEKLSTLGETYFEMYNTRNLPTTRGKMVACHDMMQYLYGLSRFSELIPDALLPFASFPQTAPLLSAVLAKDDEFVLSYFKKAGQIQFADIEGKELILNTLTNDSRPLLTANLLVRKAVSYSLSTDEIRRLNNAAARARRKLKKDSLQV